MANFFFRGWGGKKTKNLSACLLYIALLFPNWHLGPCSQWQLLYPFEHCEFSFIRATCSEGGALARFMVSSNSICWGFEGGLTWGVALWSSYNALCLSFRVKILCSIVLAILLDCLLQQQIVCSIFG